MVLEQNLDDFVAVTQKDGFARSLPLLDEGQREFQLGSGGCVLLREGEFQGLELLISVKVTLEVLQEHYFLVD